MNSSFPTGKIQKKSGTFSSVPTFRIAIKAGSSRSLRSQTQRTHQMNLTFNCGQFSVSAFEMKGQSICVALFILLFVGCQSNSYAPAPPVTEQMVAASVRKKTDPNLAMLGEGRTLFVHRCIECHTLPPLWHYRTDEWQGIVSSMSHRASLKPPECEAIMAYIRAVRCTHLKSSATTTSVTKSSNQSMKPTAPCRNKFSVFATTPCRGLSLSR